MLTPQGGDLSDTVTIDDVFPSTEETPAEETPAESTQAEAEEPESGTEEEAGEPQGEEVDAEAGDLRDKLAKEFGLDPNNHAHSKAIDRILAQDKIAAIKEKRIQDGQAYISKLKEKFDNSEFYTKFESELFKDDKSTPPQTPASTRQQPARDLPVNGSQFGDGYDHWKNGAEALQDYAKAWEAGDHGKAYEVQAAMNNRWFTQAVDPYIRDVIQREIAQRVGPVLAKNQQSEMAQLEQDCRFDAIDAIKRDPDIAKVLDEMFKTDGTSIEIDGQRYESNAIRRLIKDNPHVMDINVIKGTPKETYRATWARRYLALARIYTQEKERQTVTTEKTGEIFKAGAKKAKEELDTERVRQSINKGTSKGKSRPLSDDDAWMAEVSGSGGTIGVSAATLFRKK